MQSAAGVAFWMLGPMDMRVGLCFSGFVAHRLAMPGSLRTRRALIEYSVLAYLLAEFRAAMPHSKSTDV